MPVTFKRQTEPENGINDAEVFTRFIYRPHWFVLGKPKAPTFLRRLDDAGH